MLAERRYTVTLTAHDPTAATDSITIIVDAENVNEPPEFTGGGAAVMHDENSYRRRNLYGEMIRSRTGISGA